jgi:hypothetical protein
MATCDGAASLTSFDVDPPAFWRLGGRNDEK